VNGEQDWATQDVPYDSWGRIEGLAEGIQLMVLL